MKFDMEAMAANLRALRARKNVSQDEAARATGLNAATLSNYECGKNSPSIVNAWLLADYYGTTIDELCGMPATA